MSQTKAVSGKLKINPLPVQYPHNSSRGHSAFSKPGLEVCRSLVVRSTGDAMMKPYHDLTSNVFDHNIEEIEQIFISAAQVGSLAQIAVMLQRRAEILFSIDATDNLTGNTALIWAAMRGHAKIVQLLLRHGADVTLKNHEGHTAFDITSTQIREMMLESADQGGIHNCLCQAAWQGNIKLVKKFLAESSINVNCRNSEGLTPLLLVTRDVQLFEKLGEHIQQGFAPLEVLAELIRCKGDVKAADKRGMTALHYACSSKSSTTSKMVLHLIKSGANVDATDERCQTPLHCASFIGNADVAVALLANGADIAAKDSTGTTPLHLSAREGHEHMTRVLLDHGANPRMINDDGLTPGDVTKSKRIKHSLKIAWASSAPASLSQSLDADSNMTSPDSPEIVGQQSGVGSLESSPRQSREVSSNESDNVSSKPTGNVPYSRHEISSVAKSTPNSPLNNLSRNESRTKSGSTRVGSRGMANNPTARSPVGKKRVQLKTVPASNIVYNQESRVEKSTPPKTPDNGFLPHLPQNPALPISHTSAMDEKTGNYITLEDLFPDLENDKDSTAAKGGIPKPSSCPMIAECFPAKVIHIPQLASIFFTNIDQIYRSSIVKTTGDVSNSLHIEDHEDEVTERSCRSPIKGAHSHCTTFKSILPSGQFNINDTRVQNTNDKNLTTSEQLPQDNAESYANNLQSCIQGSPVKNQKAVQNRFVIDVDNTNIVAVVHGSTLSVDKLDDADDSLSPVDSPKLKLVKSSPCLQSVVENAPLACSDSNATKLARSDGANQKTCKIIVKGINKEPADASLPVTNATSKDVVKRSAADFKADVSQACIISINCENPPQKPQRRSSTVRSNVMTATEPLTDCSQTVTSRKIVAAATQDIISSRTEQRKGVVEISQTSGVIARSITNCDKKTGENCSKSTEDLIPALPLNLDPPQAPVRSTKKGSHNDNNQNLILKSSTNTDGNTNKNDKMTGGSVVNRDIVTLSNDRNSSCEVIRDKPLEADAADVSLSQNVKLERDSKRQKELLTTAKPLTTKPLRKTSLSKAAAETLETLSEMPNRTSARRKSCSTSPDKGGKERIAENCTESEIGRPHTGRKKKTARRTMETTSFRLSLVDGNVQNGSDRIPEVHANEERTCCHKKESVALPSVSEELKSHENDLTLNSAENNDFNPILCDLSELDQNKKCTVHNGPIITDVFESLTRLQQQQRIAESKIVSEASALPRPKTRTKSGRQVKLATSKEITSCRQTSAGKKKTLVAQSVPKAVDSETGPAKLKPNKNRKRKPKYIVNKDSNDASMDDIITSPDVKLIGGIGWHIAASCISSDVATDRIYSPNIISPVLSEVRSLASVTPLSCSRRSCHNRSRSSDFSPTPISTRNECELAAGEKFSPKSCSLTEKTQNKMTSVLSDSVSNEQPQVCSDAKTRDDRISENLKLNFDCNESPQVDVSMIATDRLEDIRRSPADRRHMRRRRTGSSDRSSIDIGNSTVSPSTPDTSLQEHIPDSPYLSPKSTVPTERDLQIAEDIDGGTLLNVFESSCGTHAPHNGTENIEDAGKPPSGILLDVNHRGRSDAAPSNRSPRFVRKHDSYKGATRDGGRNVPMREKRRRDIELSSDGSVSLAVASDDWSLKSGDKAHLVTSRLGRSSAHSRVGSAGSNASRCTDDVEVIQWKRGNVLGKGAYGTVWCGLTNSGELIAVKMIELNIADMDKAELEYEQIQQEVEILKTLRHRNIVEYLGTCLEDNVVSIFMQYVPGGSIANILKRFSALEEEVFCNYTKQILEGVQYLHANNVIHRDIKGGNIMLMHNAVIKLIDFGCAKKLLWNVPTATSQNQLLRSVRGTPYWMAPEVVREEGHGTQSDIWSIGCTVFEMATKLPPWADMPPSAAIFAIGSESTPIPRLPTKFSAEAHSFVMACLTRDPSKRPSSIELLAHPFIVNQKKSKTSTSMNFS